MASTNIIAINKNYVAVGVDLLGGAYALEQSLYIRISDLNITNNSAQSFVNATFGTTGVIGTCEEVPDLTVPGSRMVIRLSASAAQNARLKKLLESTDFTS
jgi:hypothetical protein